jgi:hypothetical protein
MPATTTRGLASDTNSQHLTKTFLRNQQKMEIEIIAALHFT